MDKKSGFSLAEDFEDFFETALTGFIITDLHGNITRINKQGVSWLNSQSDKLIGKRFSDILSIGSRIYFETHLWPLLIMQGHFDEVTVELLDTGTGKLPVLINGYERKEDGQQTGFMRFTLFRASDRRLYEQNLQMAKQLAESNLVLEQQHANIREQFIAVLGHDLRNPLSAIHTVSQILQSANLEDKNAQLIRILQTSVKRMSEMIENVMDLARGRLGGGIPIVLQKVDPGKLLLAICDELQISNPDRRIELELDVYEQIECDPDRIGQLVSNLLANAITHGFKNTPISVKAVTNHNFWEISISNNGNPIPEKDLKYLFHPFYREKSKPSQNGLGLGLYIASEIAQAHNGKLTVCSDEKSTCFTLKVNK